MSQIRPQLAIVVAAVVIAATAGVVWRVQDGLPLTTDRQFQILRPGDGEKVSSDFVLSWKANASVGKFAVVVDHALPAPGSVVVAGPATLLVNATALRMTLAHRTGGSPSARSYHDIVVIPLDDSDRRVGESVAEVHVRGGS